MKRVTIDWDERENVEWQEYAPRAHHDARRRLLVATDNFLPRWDGISRFLSEILPRLRDAYDITVVAPDYGDAQIPGVRVVRIPLSRNRYGDYRPARFAYRRIKSLVRGSDIVFTQALGPIGLCAILAAKRCRRPVAAYIHSVEWELFPKALAAPLFRGPLVALSKLVARFLYGRCTLLILPSENIAEQFSWQRITTPKRVAHLGVDTRKFQPGDRRAAREALGLPQDAFIVGYHGRVAHEKNLVTLLRGFSRLRAHAKRLLIVGDGVPSIVARLRKRPDVLVTGFTPEVTPWLQAMDVYVQPSLTETTSLSVLEAMACGLPVVSAKVGFIKHYLIDRQNGIFFDNTDAHDLAVKLAELSRNRPLRERMGLHARKTIEKSFQWDQTAERIREALDSV